MDDLGYFGPQSVTWRVHADPMQWVGGVRALFLLTLHPLAMAGVDQHSTYREDPIGRLQRTGEYLGAVTFGTRAEADRAAARVRGVHRRVRGVEPESGTGYWAPDPELLLWVHCGEIDSFLTIARRAGVAVSAADADRYVAEQVTAAELVGIPRHLAPASTAELADYFERTRPELRVTAAARETARFLFLPPMPKLVQVATPARAVWASAAGLAFASLPRWARRLYRSPGLPTTDLGASVTLRGLRAASVVLPASIRRPPAYRAAQRRLAETPVRRLTAV
ncbi:MAG TPA: oxygenase MpaB family protein [Mycobacteriales bacterium]|nr:oxygenase MpaB family protein [Mycobacteriales bacterium]